MDDFTGQLRAALSRLLATVAILPPDIVDEHVRQEYIAARENAAKTLLKNRARSGLPWLATSDSDSFLERWEEVR